MKIIIQCAGKKHPMAPSFSFRGAPVKFFARPELFSGSTAPWDEVPTSSRFSWIDCVKALNGIAGAESWARFSNTGIGADEFFHTGDLYIPKSYSNLIDRFGYKSVYILSAGWGLLRADRLIPTYDVTFTNVPKYPWKKVTVAHRCKFDSVETHIPGNDEVHLFITGNYLDYVKRAFKLNLENRGVLHIRSTQFQPEGFGKTVEHDCGDQSTNWHYTAVKQFLSK
jgi:hypothetical protein